MKIGNFTTTNEKGQIVIPKKIRDALGIDQNVTLNISLSGNGIYIYPVEEFMTKAESESSYFHLLEKTRGKWSIDQETEKEKKKSQVEHEASKRRKKQW